MNIKEEQIKRLVNAYWSSNEDVCSNENNDDLNEYDRGYDSGYREALDFVLSTLGIDVDEI